MPTKSFSLFSGWDTKDDKADGSTRDILLKKKVLSTRNIEVELDVDNKDRVHDGDGDNNWEPIQPAEEKPEGFWKGLLHSFGGGNTDSAISGTTSEQPTAEIRDMDSLVQTARDFAKAGETAQAKPEVTIEDFQRELKPILKQLENKFSDLPKDKFDPVSLMYYLEAEDSKKTPSWKRRKHRFCNGFDLQTIYELHESLYLAEVAYVDSVEEIQQGLANFRSTKNDTQYELVYASAEGEPRRPAHYVALKKEPNDVLLDKKDAPGPFPNWLKDSSSYLEVTLVVRGTKEIADMLSDAMLEATPYREGLAHDGICQSGKWIVEKHLPLLNHLLESSQRKKIRLSLIGHSLGAGAAAIACIEFNDQPNIEATCVAFECPALLDLKSSQAHRDKITTIIADADCIPRMSGATLYNMMLNILEHDYKDTARDDVQSLLNVLSQKVPLLLPQDKLAESMDWVRSQLDQRVKPLRGLKRHEIELYPPGKCYHIYRDGVSYSFVEVGCDFFNEIDMALTMVDDHYIHSGCHAMFLDLMRKRLNQSKFDFPNDLMALRMEKPLVVEEEKEGVDQEPGEN